MRLSSSHAFDGKGWGPQKLGTLAARSHRCSKQQHRRTVPKRLPMLVLGLTSSTTRESFQSIFNWHVSASDPMRAHEKGTCVSDHLTRSFSEKKNMAKHLQMCNANNTVTLWQGRETIPSRDRLSAKCIDVLGRAGLDIGKAWHSEMTPQSFLSINLASDVIRELGRWRIDAVAETVRTEHHREQTGDFPLPTLCCAAHVTESPPRLPPYLCRGVPLVISFD